MGLPDPITPRLVRFFADRVERRARASASLGAPADMLVSGQADVNQRLVEYYDELLDPESPPWRRLAGFMLCLIVLHFAVGQLPSRFPYMLAAKGMLALTVVLYVIVVWDNVRRARRAAERVGLICPGCNGALVTLRPLEHDLPLDDALAGEREHARAHACPGRPLIASTTAR